MLKLPIRRVDSRSPNSRFVMWCRSCPCDGTAWYTLIMQSEMDLPSSTLRTTVLGLAAGWLVLFRTMGLRVCLVYISALHVEVELRVRMCVSHMLLAGPPICGIPLGSESDCSVVMVPNQGSWMSRMSASVFCSIACMCAFCLCTLTDAILRWCRDISCRPPKGRGSQRC